MKPIVLFPAPKDLKATQSVFRIAVAILAPNSVRRREAPPHTIWVFTCPYTGDYSYT
jgi:hypothetical protein